MVKARNQRRKELEVKLRKCPIMDSSGAQGYYMWHRLLLPFILQLGGAGDKPVDSLTQRSDNILA